MTRYTLARFGTRHFLLSTSSAKILTALADHGPMRYSQLQRRTKLPLQSLYVFVARLRKHKLLRVYGSPHERELAAHEFELVPLRRVG